jgi:hypothetical protein
LVTVSVSVSCLMLADPFSALLRHAAGTHDDHHGG